MNKYIKPHTISIWRIFLIALFLALIALELIRHPGTSTYLQIAGLLCIGWVFYFVDAPAGVRTLGDVYKAAQQGWRTPASAKALTILGALLISFGVYLQWQ